MDDEDLLRRSRRGDREAFSDFVNRYQDRLYTTALRVLGNAADAADVVQETFLRAWLHLEELDPPGVRAWLFRVTVNCCHDQQRRQSRRPAVTIDDGQANVIEMPDPSAGPEQQALARERSAAVLTALQQLPLELRTVLVLREINDLTYEEMAAVLRIPLGTVKSRVNRARLQLAARLRGSSMFGAGEASA